MSKKRQQEIQQAVEPQEPEEDPEDVTIRAIATYEASKAYALRGTPAYLVTLATPSGNTTVRGLDERPLDEIVRELGGPGAAPRMILRGCENLVNFGVVVARPESVVSISSYVENYPVDDGEGPGGDDEDGEGDVDGDGDGDTEGDGDDAEDGDDKITRLQHPMLGN